MKKKISAHTDSAVPHLAASDTDIDAAQTTRRQTRAAKAQFDAAHRKGMAAIKTRDTGKLDEAIREEGRAVDRLSIEHRGAKRR
jgi:hypothetical protein